MMRFDKAERWRAGHPLGYEHKAGDPFGWFLIARAGHPTLRVMANMGDFELGPAEQWDHVSVTKNVGMPTWEEMCFLKNLFWDEEDCVVQYHPPKSDYVNVAKGCLHLWRFIGGETPRPPSIFVGLK